MTDIRGKKGAWLNQFAQPSDQMFDLRARQVDYVVIKYGMAYYEGRATVLGVPWLAERMAENGVGSQNGPADAERFAIELAAQANRPGCIGAVINLEEADGGWHTDDGTQTAKLIYKFRSLCDKPLYASLDTRGVRPSYPYQRVCADLCDGVMPMVYPKAFGQQPTNAFGASLGSLVTWGTKPIIPTIQTYDGIGGNVVTASVLAAGEFNVQGINAYTLGHASVDEWAAFLSTDMKYTGVPVPPAPPAPKDLRAELLAARVTFLETMCTLAVKGTAEEVLAFATFWQNASK